MGIKWIKSSVEGRVGIVVPYRQLFNDELKAAVSSATFSRGSDAWMFDEEATHLVRPLLEKYFQSGVWYRVELDLKNAEEFTIDGCNLLYVNREYWKWRSGSGFEMKVLECTLSAGGSRRSPHVNGRLVLEIVMREGAVISPAPTSIEKIDRPTTPPNPLETVPTTAIQRELEARGVQIFDKAKIVAGLVEAGDKSGFAEMSDEEKAAVRKFLKAFNVAMKVVDTD